MNGKMDFKEFLVWNLGGLIVLLFVLGFIKGVS